MSMNDVFGASILVVDDEVEMLDIVSSQLGNGQYTLYTANSSEKAVQVIRDKQVDLVLMDLKMPETSGIELLNRLRQIRPMLECIFVTAHGSKENVQEALRLGAFDFIDKPFDWNLLGALVRKAIEKAYYESLIREVLELFVHHYTDLDFRKFSEMAFRERDHALRAALGVARMKIMKKAMERTAAKVPDDHARRK